MFEKVNPNHPDKVADRIAGAIVDLAYAQTTNPKIAVEVLIGHNKCNVIIETSTIISENDIRAAIQRITNSDTLDIEITQVPQDEHLAHNQDDGFKCGDNGIFKGMPITNEQKELSRIARNIYSKYPTDGKYILADGRLII